MAIGKKIKNYSGSYYEKLKEETEKQAQAKEKGKKEYQEVMETLNRENSRKTSGNSTDSGSTMIAQVSSDIAAPGINLGAPLRSADEIAKSILGAPLRSDIAPVGLTQQQKQQQGAAAAWNAQTGAKVTPWMMANANANYYEQAYKDYMDSEEYQEDYKKTYSKEVGQPTKNTYIPQGRLHTPKEDELKVKDDYWKTQRDLIHDQAVTQKNMEEVAKWSEEDRAALDAYVNAKIKRDMNTANPFIYIEKTKEAADNWAYLEEKYGTERLEQLAKSYERSLTAQATQQIKDLGENQATGFLGKTAASAATVGTSLIGNVTAPMGYLSEIMEGTGQYKTLDPNSLGNLPNVYSGAVRGKVAGDLEQKGTLGKVGSVAYQGGMSALDSFARLAVAGETGALALAGMGSFGQTVSDASAKGASPLQATALGVIDAGLEVMTEKVSLDNLLSKSAAGYQGAMQAVKDAFVQAGVEVSEEEISFIGSTMAEAAILREKSSYNQQIGELVANGMSYEDAKKQADRALIDEAVKTAAVSGFSGGLMSGASSVVNKVTGNAAQTRENAKLTENEQKVVDKVTNDRIAEQEQDGKKLTDKEKKQIREAVIREMEDGSIPTDTIEEVLGSESWNTYRSLKEESDEFNTLYNTPFEKRSERQNDRLKELKAKNEAKSYEEALKEAKQNSFQDSWNAVKGTRLAESYNEKGRRGQAFEADLSKYDAKQQKVIQKAVESGILNNTNRTHKFVDWIARVSADKDILFDFTNNKKLKETGFALEGKTVNGYVTKDGVTININSAKALNSVVGHEITHVVKGTKFYPELQKTLFDYAKNKGDYQGRLDSLTKLYEGVEGADIEEELTADLVGDYLFTDADFVNRLSTENRNVFQKIYDEIKYLCKVVTAGSKEARQLEKAKKKFEDAFRAKEKNTAISGAKYSIINLDSGKSYVQASRKVIHGNSVSEWRTQIYEFFRNALKDGPIEIETIEGDTLTISKYTADKARSKTVTENGISREMTKKEFLVKLHAETHIDELAEISHKNNRPAVPDGKNHSFAKNGFTYRTAYFQDSDGSYYKITLSIGEGSGVSTVYNVGKIKADDIPDGKIISTIGSKADMSSTKFSISSDGEKVNMNISDATQSQQFKRWFGDWQNHPENASKVVNADGTPKLMYHGSTEQFTVFDKSKAKGSGHYGRGFYFTDSESQAGVYGNQYCVYLNVKHPLQYGTETVSREQVRSFLEAVAENEDYSIENYGTYDVEAILNTVMGSGKTIDAFQVIQDINVTAIGDMVEAAELFNSITGTKFDGIIVPTETVVFRPEQIKSATDNIGTFDGSNPDIRYSLSEDSGQPKTYGNWNVSGKDIALDIAPVGENVAVQEAQAAQPQETEEEMKSRTASEAIREVIGGDEKTAGSEETTVRVTSGNSAIKEIGKEKNTLAYTLATNIDNVRDMAPVAALTGREFNNRGVKISDQVKGFFKSLGNKITRPGFGDVNLGEYGIGGLLNHRPINRAKILSVAAAPDVIQNGRQIGYDPNWKARGYESFIFAAPVTIGDVEVYVAAVVDRRPDNKFYLSEMVDSEGNYVRIEESPSGNSKNGLPMGLEHQQGRDYAGPEGLSERDDPSATNAEPTPHSNSIITDGSRDVNREDANPESSVGAAEKGFTGKEVYYDLLTDENSQPDRPGDVRPMEVPKTDAYGRRVSETTANAYGAEVTPDAMASRIEELVADGALGFDTRTNKQSLENAAAEIQKRGMATTRNQITKSIANGKIRDGDIEKAMLLYASYANQNSQSAQDNAAEIMVDLATMANMTGRNLQLFKMLRRLTPDGQLMTVQKNVERYVDQLNTRRGKNHQAEVNIPQEMMEQYREAAQADIQEQSAETARAKEDVEQAIYKVAAAQIKATPMEKLNAWRYMAMLGNVKTQVRNVAGNAAFRPYVATKRAIGAVMEQMFVEQGSRTKSILGFGKNARALRAWAAQDAKSADTEKLFDYSARTGDAARGQIDENRAIYDTKALEATRKFIQAVPEGADMIFKRAEYTVSLASFLKARGYTAADLEAGNVAENVLNEARSYAAQEALKATFNDQNAVSDFVSKRYRGNNAFGKAMNLMAEGVMPFRRTPANILVRAAEYSPANIGRSMYNFATKVRSGEMTASTAIDQMAAGLTGTGAMVLGYAMASGVFGFKLVGHLDDEDEKNAGHQAYAIELERRNVNLFGYSFEIGGNSYTVDWAAPANIPLFVGANIYDAMKNRDPDTGWFVNAVDASVNSLEPMLELSCLSSLNDLMESVRYAEDGSEVYTVVAQGATSYLNQYIPTLFGQIEQAAEGEKKQVYSNADTALERSMEKTIGRATQKIPGVDLYQTQKFDNWGRPVETSNPFDAFLSPSYSSKISTDPVDAEIQRLNGAQDQNVSIGKPAQTVTYTDTDGTLHKNERLTAQQWETVQQVYGQTAKGILDDVIESKDYKALSDSQKAEVFSLVYDYAREKSRAAAVQDYAGAGDSWMEGIEGNEGAAIIRKVAESSITDSISALYEAWKNGWDDGRAEDSLRESYEVYRDLSKKQQDQIMKDASGKTKTYLETREAGVSAKKTVELMYLLDGIEPQNGYSTVRDIQKAEAVANFSIPKKQKEATMKIYLSIAQNENLDEMLDMGYSAKDYVKAWQIYDSESGQGKKQRTIARYQKEFGISYAAAKEMYEIYG